MKNQELGSCAVHDAMRWRDDSTSETVTLGETRGCN